MLGASSSRSQESDGSSQILQVNDSVYQLYKPAGRPSIQVVFFHGLQLEPKSRDPHLSTWKCEDDSCIWPQKWLIEEIPEAQVFSVSCSGFLTNSSNATMDMYNLGENLISDLLMADIGQVSNCPVVLVGHSIGGLVIKELCCQAYRKLQESRDFQRTKLEKFLNSMRGVFYFATPHHGSPAANRLADEMGGDLLKFFKTLSTDTARLNSSFDAICKLYEKWQFAGLGEGRRTNLGWFGGGVMVAPEASARKDNFNVVEGADHFSICRPRNKLSRSFHKLKDFLIDIVDEMKVTVHAHQIHGLPKHPLDLDRRALAVRDKLTGGASLGIFGMGGIGKTTLAIRVFNIISKDFEYTCFVHDVKGIPPHELQDRVLNHFHHNGKKSDIGSAQWSHLQNKKALIALDDVDAKGQLKFLPKLEHFGAGSCVILTSRNKEVFKYYEGCIMHDVEFLKHDDAKKLVCQHAFGSKDIPDCLMDNVNAVVKKCNGLPLTLEVIGEYLRDREANVEVWIETLHRLREAEALTGENEDEVWASLRISYDTLCPKEQEIFTEAALLFRGKPLEYALAAWSSPKQTVHISWDNLVSRSLVKEIDNKVWVHEHLRDLAQNISKDSMVLSTKNDTSDSAVDLLNDNEVEAGTKCLRLHYSPYSFRKSQKTLQLDSLAKLKELKHVDLDSVSSAGSAAGLTRKMSFLRFYGRYDLALPKFEFSLNKMENLAVLELTNLQIPEESVEALGNLTNLRILSLSRLEGLVHLPENFGTLFRLRRLELTELRSVTLPKSFGNLRALEHLGLESIKSLALPESLGNLSRLVTLRISNCAELAGLPYSFGSSLMSLEKVSISNCPLIKSLPQSFSRLPGLQRLDVWSCFRFEELGDAFGNLSFLRELSLLDVALERLPPSFSRLAGLELLHIRTAGQLRSLPDAFAQWTALKDLSISSKELETLPGSFCCLKSLRRLKINCPKLETLPESLGELALLEELYLDVDRVEILPLSVCNLCSLRDFTFTSSAAKLLPESLGQLSSLKTFELECPLLEKLPDSFSRLKSLQRLTLRCAKLERLPDNFGNLSSLKGLSIQSRSLKSLPDTFGNLSSLTELSIESRSLTVLPESIRQLESLKKLTLKVGKSVRSLLDGIGKISSLDEFEFDCDGHEETPNLFEHLTCFAHRLTLTGWDTRILPAGLGSLSSLRALTLNSLRLLETLPDELGTLASLERLTITNCYMLESLPDSLGQVSSLKEVTLWLCYRLKTLPESLGGSSLTEGALPQGDQSDELRLRAEECSQTKKTEVMRVVVFFCSLLDDSRMDSLGWMPVPGGGREGTTYRRKPPMGSV